MNFAKVSTLILTIFVITANCFITINIDHEDINQVSAVLSGIIINAESHTPRWTISRSIKTVTYTAAKLFGVTVSLVAANIITEKLNTVEQPIKVLQNEQKNITQTTSDREIVSCRNINFGCHRNMCWRACDPEAVGEEIKIAKKFNSSGWCFTSAKLDDRKLQICSHLTDCSPCWDCTSICHG